MSETSPPGNLQKEPSPPTMDQENPSIDLNLQEKRRLPSWLDHFNARDLKVLFRCWVAAWVASLLMFIGPSLREIGTATFFACLVLLMVPPSGILFIFFLAGLTLIFGVTLAWAWGVIVMKAALAARPESETQAKVQALQQQAYARANSTGQPISYEARVLIFDGFMLDARVTTVYFVLICLFIYLLARIRAANPKFVLIQMFGTIIADIFLTFGPSLPSFNGTLPVSLIKPAAIGIGLGFACSVLLFPQSTSHTVLAAMEDVVDLLKSPLNLTAASLTKDGARLDLQHLQKVKAKTIAAYKEMEPGMAFLQLDFSKGRWNADDVKSLKEPVRRALISSMSLLEFHIARIGGEIKLEKFPAISRGQTPTESIVDEKRGVGHHQLMHSAGFVQALRSPESEALRLEMVDALRKSTAEILPACLDAIALVGESIHVVNCSRWFGRPSKQQYDHLLQKGVTTLETLRSARTSFAIETTQRLLQTHADLFDDDGKLKVLDNVDVHPLRGVMLGMVFEEHLLGVADALEKLLARVTQLYEGRTKDRLWFPSGLRYAAAWALKRKVAAPIPGQDPVVDPDIVEEQSKEAQRRLRISRGYGVKRRTGLGEVIVRTYHWLINAEGMYALRMVVLTIALSIPAVIPSSAGFYYREKGLWGLIMGQTTLLVYMADFTFSLISRIVGTVIGGVLGLLAWYIGSANGPGNPYGLGAIMAVVIAILMWGRLFFGPALLQATIMAAATCVLVVGYSFDHTHMTQYGDPGVGYSVFWRRLVLVLVGFAGALVVQIFPRPPSASRHICKTLSNSLRTLSDHYALMLSCWGQRDNKIGMVAEQISLELAEKLMSLDGPIALLRLEFSSSPFDSHTLGQVKALCQEMNHALGRLLYLSVSLPIELQERLAQTAGILDHRNIGDIMAVLSVVEQALKTGDALPERLPTPLLKRCHEYWRSSNLEILLNTELLRDASYRKFCVAVSSYLKFLSAIDELVLVVKGTLGESHIVSKELLDEV